MRVFLLQNLYLQNAKPNWKTSKLRFSMMFSHVWLMKLFTVFNSGIISWGGEGNLIKTNKNPPPNHLARRVGGPTTTTKRMTRQISKRPIAQSCSCLMLSRPPPPWMMEQTATSTTFSHRRATEIAMLLKRKIWLITIVVHAGYGLGGQVMSSRHHRVRTLLPVMKSIFFTLAKGGQAIKCMTVTIRLTTGLPILGAMSKFNWNHR